MPAHRFAFNVRYDIDYRTTENAFAPGNDSLLQAMGPSDDGRVLVYLDAGLVQADPTLPQRINSWFAHLEQGPQLAALPEVVPGGEVIKQDLGILDRVAGQVADQHIDRHSWIFIAGGGAVLDAIGCAASLIHRGIRQIRLPSTTLAQADAGLGVKNGLNHLDQKNFLGTFTPPWAIINDRRFLRLQDDRSWRAGIAEAFKVALIKDAKFLAWLIERAPRLGERCQQSLNKVVDRCAYLHLQHIITAGDPFEHGSSRPLDFGHWSAHRLEVLSRHELSHGEAVAIGIAADALYAGAQDWLSTSLIDLYLDALQQIGFRLWHPALDLREADGTRCLYRGLDQFREHLGGQLTLCMPDGAGKRQDISAIDRPVFEQGLVRLRQLAHRSNHSAKS